MFTSDKKSATAMLIVICMALQLVFPLFVFSDAVSGTIVNGDIEVPMTVSPETNELGLMVNAVDMANAFSIEHIFDSKNKAFIMYTEEHGKIVLMHNATSFYSGENIYLCDPCFYVFNGMPMVEAGFFCTMFSSDFSYDENRNILNIHENTISDSIPKIIYGDTETPLYIEPVNFDGKGLVVVATDIASAFGVKYEYNPETATATFTSPDGTYIELTDGATVFKSSHGEFECGSFFFVENNLPFVNVDFFCDLYRVSYTYDKDSGSITIDDTVTLFEIADMEAENAAMELMSDTVISGGVYFPAGAPAGGLRVNLVLQQIGRRYDMYQNYSYYVGNSYNLGYVSFSESQTQASYSLDVSQYYNANYPYFSLYYSISDAGDYGYYTTSYETARINYSPMEYQQRYISNAYRFDYANRSNVNFIINSHYLSGTFSIPESIPQNYPELEVELILQTRSPTYGGMYGQDYYYRASELFTLGTTLLSGADKSVDYSYCITDCFPDGNYQYYSLFYKAIPYMGDVNYGYINSRGTISTTSNAPKTGTCYDTSPYCYALTASNTVDFDLPVSSVGDSGGGTVTKVSTPQFENISAAANGTPVIRITTSTPDADIYITTDGTEPSQNNGSQYTYPLVLTHSQVIKAVAVKSGMENSDVATYEYIDQNIPSQDRPMLKVVSTEAHAGGTVNVDVLVSNNPGFAAMLFDIDYDMSAMTLTDVTVNDRLFAENFVEGVISETPYTFVAYTPDGDIMSEGSLVTFTFQINEDCAEGSYPIMISRLDCCNINEETVDFVCVGGQVNVSVSMAGDVTGDGRLDTNDLLSLAKFLSGWDVEISGNADLNGDGIVNIKDLLRLAKYFAGWDVVLG